MILMMPNTDGTRNEAIQPDGAIVDGLDDSLPAPAGGNASNWAALDDYRLQKRKLAKLQVAERQAEVDRIRRVREDFSPALLRILEYAKTLYSDDTDELQLLITKSLAKLIALVSVAGSNDGDKRTQRSQKRHRPR